MLDPEFAKWLVTLGVGGVLAGFMFVFYRKDVQQYTELWKAATDQLMTVVKENTASNTKLINLIETQERNSIRKEDIAHMIERISERERLERLDKQAAAEKEARTSARR